MTISAKIICDSVSSHCGGGPIRITTMELTYPRFIHAEFMTHRVFSRNASSSRAIPVQKQIDMIRENPAMPIHWGKNQSGMQAREEGTNDVVLQVLDSAGCYDMRLSPQKAWLQARDEAIRIAEAFNAAGYHKQIVNRILEPFSHITVLVTSTQWANFFALRDHEDAQPEIRELAIQMCKAMDASEPTLLTTKEWHLPYIEDQDIEGVTALLASRCITGDAPSKEDINKHLCAISAARCARVSYLTHDKKRPTIDEDIALFQRLAMANPPHMSPCEHQAIYAGSGQSGNFGDWKQFRHTLKNNTVPG